MLLKDGQINLEWVEAQDWFKELEKTPQDPKHHAEGNVLIHTKMVMWKIQQHDDIELSLAALFHDIGKPRKTIISDYGITSAGHSKAGEIIAREIMYRDGSVSFDMRERICGMVRYHQVPFHYDGLSKLKVFGSSLVVENRELASLAEADCTGRISDSIEESLYNVELFKEFCIENDCLDRSAKFTSDSARVKSFTTKEMQYYPYSNEDEHFECTMFMMCGLPGSGKDYFVNKELDYPDVCLDKIRLKLGIGPEDEQGEVIQHAKNLARENLRKKQSFVWNATNITKQRRAQIIQLAIDYGAKVHIIYIEKPIETLLKQNKNRNAAVPESVIHRMLAKLEVPTIQEAHEVTYLTANNSHGRVTGS